MPVPHERRPPQRLGIAPLAAPDVKWHTLCVEDHPGHLTVARDPLEFAERDDRAVVELGHGHGPHLRLVVLGRTWRRAPVSDPLSGLRAYRIVVLKKALRESGDEPLLTREGWGANVELLRRVAPHARRIEEEALNVQYGIRQRETRVRMGATLRDLMAVRGLDWSGSEAEGDTDAQ